MDFIIFRYSHIRAASFKNSDFRVKDGETVPTNLRNTISGLNIGHVDGYWRINK
ncbi:MAG: hypothetical protein Q8M97_11445 [Methanobacteriaceae archaeon]|nr:hypothetical protein [Methanobacteriaceae archaeon]